MRKPVLCIARNILTLCISSLTVGCQRSDTNSAADRLSTSSISSQSQSCDFDSADTTDRQSQTAAVAIDLSGSMEAPLSARCHSVGTVVAKLFDSLQEKVDLDLVVVATSKKAAPQIILDFTHISTSFDVDIDDPMASLETIESQERALRQARRDQLRNCVTARCNRATTNTNSHVLDLTEGTLQQIGVRCKKDPSHCQKVSLFIASDLADANIFANNARSRIKNATLGIKSLEVTACGTHQVTATNLTQQQRYTNAWKRVFGSLDVLPTCPG